MWLYDSGHGCTQKCVVIRLVRLLLRRQPTTNTTQWLYVLAHGYTWLYIVHVPHSLQVHLMDVTSSTLHCRVRKNSEGCFMWLYDSGHGYTQKCVVIRLIRLLLRRQPATNTSRWLYVLARGYMWLYFIYIPQPPGPYNSCPP